jgi:DNA repair protein RecN (Recombination protein N)
MLLELTVRNYALIDSLVVSFEKGLNIITGETGAGKSSITGAIGFLLGAKADSGVIRSGCEEAVVSARLDIGGRLDTNARPDGEAADALALWLAERDIAACDGELIVRRSLKLSGRGSIFIQNVPVTRADLADCMALLFDIHGQHAHESLLKTAAHRVYLDRFGGLCGEALSFNELFCRLSDLRKRAESAVISEKERLARRDLLVFAVDEIDAARLKSGEYRELASESAKLASFEKLAGFVESACDAFCDATSGALAQTRKTHSALGAACALDAELSALDGRLAELFYEAEDIARELKQYREALCFDPGRLEVVEERLAFIGKLKKKYVKDEGRAAAPEDAILAYKAEAEAEIDALSRSEENREKTRAEIAALEKTIFERSRVLSARRAAAGADLSARVSAILARLGMPAAAFSVSLARKGAAAGLDGQNVVLGPYGADDVEFLFTANQGEGARELARIASGGELSRVMLAIKTALVTGVEGAGEQSADTLVFDEIDTGIGGEVAGAVGDYLVKIGEVKQIFCVTHLAVIAAKAHNHLKVEKTQSGGRTITQMRALKPEERQAEIARMLSGSASGAALVHAGELLRGHGEGYAGNE